MALAAFAHLEHHIALGLLHFEHRADGTAPLGHQGIQAPAAANQAAHRPGFDATGCHATLRVRAMAKQQGAMGGTVLAGDAPQLGGLGTGVIQATDQVVDGRAAGID